MAEGWTRLHEGASTPGGCLDCNLDVACNERNNALLSHNNKGQRGEDGHLPIVLVFVRCFLRRKHGSVDLSSLPILPSIQLRAVSETYNAIRHPVHSLPTPDELLLTSTDDSCPRQLCQLQPEGTVLIVPRE